MLHRYKSLLVKQREREVAQRRQEEAERQAKARLREQEEEGRKILDEERAGKPKTAGERMHEEEELRKKRERWRREAVAKIKERISKAAAEKQRLENDLKAKERLEKMRQVETEQKTADQKKEAKKPRKARANARKKEQLRREEEFREECAMRHQQEIKEQERESAERAFKRATETGDIRTALEWIQTRQHGYLEIIYKEEKELDINEVYRYIGWTKKKGATVCLHCSNKVEAFSFRLPTGEAFCNPCKTKTSRCELPPRGFSSSTSAGLPTE